VGNYQSDFIHLEFFQLVVLNNDVGEEPKSCVDPVGNVAFLKATFYEIIDNFSGCSHLDFNNKSFQK